VQHFKNLNTEDNNLNQFQQHIVKILDELINKLQTDNRVNKLNDKIKPEEIIKAIRKLKKMVKVQPMIVSQIA
jgi:hypothetical protein